MVWVDEGVVGLAVCVNRPLPVNVVGAAGQGGPGAFVVRGGVVGANACF